MKSELEEILEHAWELFIHLDDDVNEDVIRSAKFFIGRFDFDIEELPKNLYNAIASEIYKDSVESSL